MADPSADSSKQRGCIQIYTGSGKGKTTAALGLCLRAVGAGYRVYIAQFMKSGIYSEIKALERLGDQVVLEQFGTGRFVRGNPTEEDRRLALEGLQAVRKAFVTGDFQMVIMDESMIALHQGLFTSDQLLELLGTRPPFTELVLTGRHAPPGIVDIADLVTDMQEVKHYYREGIMARTGIEK